MFICCRRHKSLLNELLKRTSAAAAPPASIRFSVGPTEFASCSECETPCVFFFQARKLAVERAIAYIAHLTLDCECSPYHMFVRPVYGTAYKYFFRTIEKKVDPQWRDCSTNFSAHEIDRSNRAQSEMRLLGALQALSDAVHVQLPYHGSPRMAVSYSSGTDEIDYHPLFVSTHSGHSAHFD
jgi:hypothetical protein